MSGLLDRPKPVLLAGPQKAFDPEGAGYDYDAAIAAGMQPATSGPNVGHWGSVVPAEVEAIKRNKLPQGSYLILKGRNHPTWGKAVEAEIARGFRIIRRGNRYWSVPAEGAGQP